jgi:hypothetical protein
MRVPSNPIRSKLDGAIRYTTDLARHEQLIAALTGPPSSILPVPTDDPIRPKCDQGWYVCYEFAFGVTDLPSYVQIRKYYEDERFSKDECPSVGQRLVEWLLRKNVLVPKNVLVEVERQRARDGDVIIYFGSRVFEGGPLGHAVPMHAGLMRRGRVVSKWGRYHPLYDHEVEEVPELYGDECTFFKDVSPELVYREFLEFYKSKIPESLQ